MACGCVVENTDLVVYYIKAAYYMGIYYTDTDETPGLVPVSVNFRVSVSVPVSV